MSILKQAISEIAAGGSGSATGIAGAYGSLFGGGIVDLDAIQKRRRRMLKKIGYIPINEKEERSFNPADVFSKVDDAAEKANSNKNTVGFALEDTDGNLVRVYVPAEQAEEFERALAHSLEEQITNRDSSDYSAGTDDEAAQTKEIAEVLYDLKDKFTLVRVEWPVIETDQEEEQEVAGGEAAAGGEGGGARASARGATTGDDMGGEGGEGGEGDDMSASASAEGSINPETGEVDLEKEMSVGDDDGESDAKSALQSVIDMMKADAEAKKAQAEADKAKAEAEAASHTARAAEAKVSAEEEVLDMEAYYEKEKKKEDEAKQIRKLAKYRHDVANDEDESGSRTVVSRSEKRSDDGDVVRTQTVASEEEEEYDDMVAAKEADRQKLLNFLLHALEANE